MTTEFKIIGFTDSVNECDCCGKTNLKGTYCVSVDGVEMYYGVTCAANALGTTSKEIKAEATKIKNIENIDLAMAEAKTDYSKANVLKTALKKGYSKDDLFKKHGVISGSTTWENFYTIAHITHAIAK